MWIHLEEFFCNYLSFSIIYFRFHKLIWGSHGVDSSSSSSGLLIGGSDNGIISIYDAKKIISGDVDDSILFQSSKHTGTVHL